MSSLSPRNSRSVVDTIAQRGYDNINRLDKKFKDLKSKPQRFCSHESCSLRLSIYNDTEFCYNHQKENIPLRSFL
jgi:hypothetical protein